MLTKRLLVTVILSPVVLGAVVLGGPVFVGLVTLSAGLAAWEYTQLMQVGGRRPPAFLVVGGTVLLVLGRAWDGFDSTPWIISLLVLGAMTYHLVAYEQGHEHSGTDFGVTLAGPFYIGWLSAYLLSLRNLPDGLWWLLLALPSVWIADSGAYVIGRRLGRHPLAPRLSPHKTWEGYLGGVVAGTFGGAVIGALVSWSLGPATTISALRGTLVGLVVALLTPLGDLGESMFKRQAGVKDSGNLLPGHGGVFDRIDSWLWAGVIGYAMVIWLFI